MSNALESLGRAYKEANPGRDCRWVYDPQSKPELSSVTSRQAEGYVLVYPPNLGTGPIPRMKEDEPVRVADLVLMGISEKARRELEQDRADLATEAIAMVDRRYYQAIEEMSIPNAQERHRPKPIGRSVIETKTFEYDIEQRSGEEV